MLLVVRSAHAPKVGMMVDPGTAREFSNATKEARRRGLALVELLDQRGLLATPHLEHDLVHRELLALLEAIEQRGPEMLMRRRWSRTHGSPADMYTALMEFAHAYVKSKQM